MRLRSRVLGRHNIAEGLVLCKALTNDWGSNKQPISSLMLLMWKVVLNTT